MFKKLLFFLLAWLLTLGYAHAQIINKAVIVRLGVIAGYTDYQQQDLEAAGEILTKRLEASGLTDQEFHITYTDLRYIDIHTTLNLTDQILPLVGNVGLLEFVDFSTAEDIPLEGECILTTAQAEAFHTALCALPKDAPQPLTLPDEQPFPTVMMGKELTHIQIKYSEQPNPNIVSFPWLGFTLSEEGSKIFAAFTSQHIGKPLAIVLNGKVISVPIIEAKIIDEGAISANFSQAEVEELALILQSGSLPLPLELVEVVREDK